MCHEEWGVPTGIPLTLAGILGNGDAFGAIVWGGAAGLAAAVLCGRARGPLSRVRLMMMGSSSHQTSALFSPPPPTPGVEACGRRSAHFFEPKALDASIGAFSV